jgi:hypothetical protein
MKSEDRVFIPKERINFIRNSKIKFGDDPEVKNSVYNSFMISPNEMKPRFDYNKIKYIMMNIIFIQLKEFLFGKTLEKCILSFILIYLKINIILQIKMLVILILILEKFGTLLQIDILWELQESMKL